MAGSLGKGSAAIASSSTRWAVPSARCQASAHSSGAGRVVASAAARAWGSARTTRAALAVESRHPAGSTTTWGTRLLAASQAVTAFEVSGAPKRSTASGTIRSSMPTVASRSPEASTGTGVTAAQARLGVGQHRDPECRRQAGDRLGVDRGERAHHGDDPPPPDQGVDLGNRGQIGHHHPGGDGRSGRRRRRRRLPGRQHQVVFEGEVEVDRSRRHADASAQAWAARRAAPCRRGRSGHRPLVEPADGVAVQLHLVDGLRGTDVAQPVGAVGGQHQQRHPRQVRLDHGRVVLGGGGPGRTHQGDRATRRLGDPQGEETGAPFVDHAPIGDPAVGGEGGGQRGVARPRGDHRIGDPQVGESADEGGGEAMGGDGGVHLAEARPSEVARRWGLGGPPSHSDEPSGEEP